MKWVLEDPSYITGGELEYPRELFPVPGPDDLTLLQYKRPEGFLASYSVDGVTSVTVVILRYILGVPVGPVFLLGLLNPAIVCSYELPRAGKHITTNSLGTGSLPSGRNPTGEDGDIGMGDSTRVSVSLGGGISSGGKKSQESNIGDSDNTGDGGKTARGGIVTYGGLMASYACMISIYESSCKGEKTMVAKVTY
ncbi:hypothetical protein Tco_0954127 [Tanacetum coccineum]|uniref:Uncharacterized protein n=1 Tax=Tanacetum coccineum TaxID=301880 RepID=A0ABQ5E2M0_9ASTR